MNINQLFANNYNKLNSKEIKILEEIINNKNFYKSLNSDEIANKFLISRSSFLRIIRKLSLNSFSDFKFILSLNENKKEDFMPEFNIICDDYMMFLDDLDKESYRNISKLIYKANNIYVYGTGNEQKNICQYLKIKLLSIGKSVVDLFDYGEVVSIKENFNKDDLFFLISLSGENEDAINIIKNISGLIKCISFTKLKFNSLSIISDENIYAYTKKYSLYKDKSYELISIFYAIIDLVLIDYNKYVEEKYENRRAD